MDIKRQALAQVFPEVLAASLSSQRALTEFNLIHWLRKL
jgi:hypothetical protein